MTNPTLPELPEQLIDQHLDNILRAAGSALRHYTMQKSKDDMRAAMRAYALAALSSAQGEAVATGANPPYSNCKYKICDLPGQCLGEGSCHHPASGERLHPSHDAGAERG